MKTSVWFLTCLLWLAAISSTSVRAEPAAWYIWESKLNAHRLCAQVSPGEGWIKRLGPFKNAQCR
jgi:hypothetical protein